MIYPFLLQRNIMAGDCFVYITCSVNLMACMMSMTNLAKKRPQFMTQVIEGFESLHGKFSEISHVL